MMLTNRAGPCDKNVRESKTAGVDKTIAKEPAKEPRSKVLGAIAKKAADKLKAAQRKGEIVADSMSDDKLSA
jgi:hypothetical protein